MSLHIDSKYIGLISSRLEKFQKKRDYLYNFRCPICGDSKKNKNKCRGFFYKKNVDMFFICHNCGKGLTLSNFIKELDVSLHREYITERFKGGENKHSNYEKPEQIKQPVRNFDVYSPIDIVEGLESISELSPQHFAYEYVVYRKIPEKFYSSLYYTNDFKGFIDLLVPNNEYQLKALDMRLVIPFIGSKGNLIAVQGRTLSNNELRYITIKVDRGAPKIFGLDRLDVKRHIYVVEGVFDSLFISNCIAAGGSDLPKIIQLKDRMTIIYDNEPRNIEIIHRMEKFIGLGFKVCIWPTYLALKDINDMVICGFPPKEILRIINSNTFDGLKAKLKLENWRKV